jgi:hypothetical protein
LALTPAPEINTGGGEISQSAALPFAEPNRNARLQMQSDTINGHNLVRSIGGGGDAQRYGLGLTAVLMICYNRPK